MSNEFIWPVRVYYEDTDSGGVVYHSNYLNFMERARTEWLRSLQLEQDDIIRKYDIMFVVRSLSIDYIKPALFNDALIVKSTIQKLGRASLTFEQFIMRHNDEEILTRGLVKVASLNVTKKRPAAMPKAVYNQFVSL
ncbi:MAG: tol-pal system-associated acyl-CoA thioesterase [gamma proteobacterium symbiont of Taylorina sp.]|nr:tol-pal system-associated acyl-CoA thioesterase [gamma proteobacterium symbiont of Taylorina sp.]